MRIVIDMQGAQTESRFRGIGRYTLSFAQAVVRNRGQHEIILALNGLFPETIEPIRAAFDGLLPQENIRVWHAPGPVREEHPGNDTRRQIAELIRESFLASLQPDVIHICSLFEGYVDDAITSIGQFDQRTPVSVTLYDLIPLLNPDQYLRPNPRYAQYYERKIKSLIKASVMLAISEFSRQEGLTVLGKLSRPNIVTVSTAIDDHFRLLDINADTKQRLQQKFQIHRPFLLYTGGCDERKNLMRLIQAYAMLPVALRQTHQLVLAGHMHDGEILSLKHCAKISGLQADELVFTNYVTDEELVQLYNICKLFVFPSWHEGFGLPVLEAMACGAPVIGANTSSVPEVIGLSEALFDPFDTTAMSAVMQRALVDIDFQNRLRKHGLQRVKLFSWDATAKRAIAAWEALGVLPTNSYLDRTLNYSLLLGTIAQQIKKEDESHLIALSSCLAINQQAGIERQLLLDISELCQRDAATGVQRVVRSYLKWLLQSPPPGFRVEPVYATLDEGYRYARRYTMRFLGLCDDEVADTPIRWQRGDLFFGLDMQHHVQLAHRAFYHQLRQDGVIVKFLVHDLLPIQLPEFFKDSKIKELHEKWLTMIAETDGVICVSRATSEVFAQWIADVNVVLYPTFQNTWVHNGGDIESSVPSRGLPPDAAETLDVIRTRPTFLCVATLEPRKGQQQILDAMEDLWMQGIDANLVLVGQQGWKIESLVDKIRCHPEHGKRLFWLQGISDEYLEQIYLASTCLVAASINEGFGLPLIEAARHGLPIVARDIPVFREVAGDAAFYFSGNTAVELAQALIAWLDLHRQGKHPKSTGMQWSTWQQSAEKLKNALVRHDYRRRQLLVDISELVQRDAKTGIQRVVRSILKQWLMNPPACYRVEPIYATLDHGYRYARQFVSRFLGNLDETLRDDPIDYAPGDVFFGLDLQPLVQTAQREFYQELRRQGIRVEFMLYDLLCIEFPQYFPRGATEGFQRWLDVVAENDGVVCISKTVANKFSTWLKEKNKNHLRPFNINWSHIAADIDDSTPSYGVPADAEIVLNQLHNRDSFLMVGTLEPRKGHMQVLAAFEQLWQVGTDINLVIVGKVGWMVESLIQRLRNHPELNKRLFWLEGISDEYLEKVYAASTCLIAASYDEGFGLPLIEAAQHKLPIIARDIPVFREVAEGYAYYFNAEDPEGLAQAITDWLELYRSQKHPRSDDMKWLTWKESASQLLSVLGLD